MGCDWKQNKKEENQTWRTVFIEIDFSEYKRWYCPVICTYQAYATFLVLRSKHYYTAGVARHHLMFAQALKGIRYYRSEK